MELFSKTIERIESTAIGMLIGHQIGQWSERRWWGALGEDRGFLDDMLNPKLLNIVLQDPPTITTPGWSPTGYGDLVPYICAMGMEYFHQKEELSPEQFRDFLLREREWLRPQAVGRTCIELMAEGMNPRIAGLYAPSVLAGCWIAFPIAFYHAGYPDHAYEDAVLLSRTQVGGDGVILNALIATMLSSALSPDSTWADVKHELLRMADKRDARIASLVRYALDAGKNSTEWIKAIQDKDFRQKISKTNIDWIVDFYTAIAGMESFAEHSMDVPTLMRSILSCCDGRFGSMIVLSLITAIYRCESIPDIWREYVTDLHKESISEWVTGSINLLKAKLKNESQISNEILTLADGENSLLYDKILAGLLAGAIGNVMGSPVEDRDYPWIIEHYGVLDKLLSPERLESEDDSAMTKIWAETFIHCQGSAYAEDLADMFRKKLIPFRYYYDSQHAYNLMIEGIPPHACGHWNIVTGSAMMGCSPCGMYHAGDPKRAYANAVELAYHYQRGFDVYATGILCAAVAESLRPGATVESVLESAIESAPGEPMVYFNCHEPRDTRTHLRNALIAVEGCSDVLAAREPLYAGFLEYNGQDPWEVVTFTLAIFKVAKGDVWQCMIGGTNIGRDSDTISNLSAVLSACLHGTASIPKHLLSLFSDTALAEYKQLADNLTRVVQERCKRSLDTAHNLGVW